MVSKRWMWLVAVVASAAWTGCGGIIGSCTQSANGLVLSCTEFEEYPAGREMIQQTCEGGGGTFSTAACTSQNRVGRCRISMSLLGISSRTVQSYYAPLTTEAAQASCTSEASGSLVKVEFLR